MKKKLSLLPLIFPFFLFSNDFDSENILNLAEAGDGNQIEKIFENNSNLSIRQGNSFLNKLAAEIHSNFGIGTEFDTLKQELWSIIDSQETGENQRLIVKKFFSGIFDESFNDKKKEVSTKPFNLAQSLGMFTLGARIHPIFWFRTEITNGLIIGAVETLAGALLWLTPFRSVGTGMMVDGVRRMLNAVEEEPDQNDEKFEEKKRSID